MNKGIEIVSSWFDRRGWKIMPFQHECWHEYLQGKSGLLNAPTGSGKTLALWMPCLAEFINAHPDYKHTRRIGLQVLWITPLRALSRDIQRAMQQVCDELEIPWTVALRTGDTSTSERARQQKNNPECLITTPESLHLMLTQKHYRNFFKNLKAVVVDEWHELLGTKRGTQIELGLSRLVPLQPSLKIWGISATIGNLAQAAEVLTSPLSAKAREEKVLVKSEIKKNIVVEAILPDEVERFPWAGHLGVKLIPKILPIIENSRTTLLFTNTRAQTEIWYQTLLAQAPELAGAIAMHHGSLDNELRNWVEAALHEGKLKLVVCTSTLDLGVDFRPVETVIQVGSPKVAGRFIQRAGRSGHQPDADSKIYFLPVHSLELIEAAALRQAIADKRIEPRTPIIKPFDVLVQYLVTLAVSDGFEEQEIYNELVTTYSYRDLTRHEWEWALEFIISGGNSLTQYDEFRKVELEEGIYKVNSKKAAMRHRLSVGTIVSEPLIRVKFMHGGHIGSVEESFISRLHEGDVFFFAGRMLEFIKIHEMTALVKKSSKKRGQVARWMGARLPLSPELAMLIREKLDKARAYVDHIKQKSLAPEDHDLDIELKKIYPLLEVQYHWSLIPRHDELLIEKVTTREGCHLFIYAFEGRWVHEVLAALVAYRISVLTPITFSMAMNDYGFELLSDQDIPIEQVDTVALFSSEHILEHLYLSMNQTEMARRKFRDIAAISGLTFQGYPGKYVRSKHLQANSQLIFDVFLQYDPENLLIKQAYTEVLNKQLDYHRLKQAMDRIAQQKVVIIKPPMPTPFGFPIMVDRLRDELSSESLEDRVKKMQLQLEKYSDEHTIR